MRLPIIAANWKMHKTVKDSLQFAKDFVGMLGEDHKGIEIVICPPFTALYSLGERLRGTGIEAGAQDMFWEEWGAYTGEISPGMLLETGAKYVIIGHSERRYVLGEDDTAVNRKVKRALASGLCPIMCVGETLAEREEGRAVSVVRQQLEEGLKGVELLRPHLVIAYEPVWAIGTGVNASPQDAQEMSRLIRDELGSLFGVEVAQEMRILYGGSVNPGNIGGFVAQPDIDGALVGGASLEARSLADIVKQTEESVYGS
ncbi:MAG TPA: triose-phosphate isomerase [Syntrophothermus lipocalidus]|nr:triose-phosphate isomerase [Syntrophothermus lipocalidus]